MGEKEVLIKYMEDKEVKVKKIVAENVNSISEMVDKEVERLKELGIKPWVVIVK